jgi:hypothetical protein
LHFVNFLGLLLLLLGVHDILFEVLVLLPLAHLVVLVVIGHPPGAPLVVFKLRDILLLRELGSHLSFDLGLQ